MLTLVNGINQYGRIPVLNVNVLLVSECLCVVDIYICTTMHARRSLLLYFCFKLLYYMF